MAATDALAVILAVSVTKLARFGIQPLDLALLVMLVAAAGAWLGIALFLRLYKIHLLSPAEEFRRIVEGTGILAAIGLLFGLFMGGTVVRILTRGWLFLATFLVLLFLLIGRQAWHKRMGRLRAGGKLSYRTLIVGTNDEAGRIAGVLNSPNSALGFHPVGFLQTGGSSGDLDGLPVLGGPQDLELVLVEHGIECVFVASTAVESEFILEASRIMRRFDVEVRVSANMTEIHSSRLTVQPVGDLLALSLRPARLTRPQALAKRTLDLVMGSLVILATSPLWILAAVAIKLTSRGRVLFKQERVGRYGEILSVYKFRTMIDGAESLLADLRELNEGTGPLFKIKGDPRITRVGRVLRKYSIDELPQLINVMKGDMSLVGPRPLPAIQMGAYEDWHQGRLEVKPGITGLWQIRGRGEQNFDDVVKLDLFYIENWSILYDLFIIGKTVPAVLFRKGAS